MRLSAANPDHADAFRENGDRCRDEIAALDQDVRQSLAALPRNRRKTVIPHDAFAYFAESFDLTVVASRA